MRSFAIHERGKMGKVLCFGEALIDMLALPPEGGGAPRMFMQNAGGAPANVAVAVAKLGGDAHFIGMLGNDMFGDFLLRELQDARVGTEDVVRTDAAKTALAFVALDAAGERSFSFYRPPAADLLFREKHFRDDIFESAAVFHACSNSMTEPAIAEVTLEGMRRARKAGAVVSFDMNLRPMLWPADVDPLPLLWQALVLADVVKLSREELDYLVAAMEGGEHAVVERIWQGAARLLVVTDAERPARWSTRDASGVVPGFRVDVMDSTGAGDAFVSGMLFRLAREESATDALDVLCEHTERILPTLRFAAAVGALAVTRKGAFAAMPSLDDVLSLMQEQA